MSAVTKSLIMLNCNLYVAIMAELQSAANVSDVSFPDPTIEFSTSSSIFIPASYIQERSMTTGKLYDVT